MKRTLAFLLILVLLLPALFSCSGKSAEGGETDLTPDSPAAVNPPEEDAEPEETELTLAERTGVPEDTNYDGWNFNALVYANQNWGWDEIVYDELTGETLNDAFYNRNLLVESLLGITITQTARDAGQLAGLFRSSVTSGDGAYAAGWLRQKEAASSAMSNLCLDLNDLSLDLSHPWWDYHSIEDTTMGGKNYLVASDISIADKDAIWVIYFDKQIREDTGLESPYDLVDSGQWTQDKMKEMMDKAVLDVNGDGKMDKHDRWGLLTHSENFAASWLAAGEKIVSINEAGLPVATYENERFYNVWDKTLALMKSDSCYYHDIGFISSGLRDGNTLFATEVIAFLRVYRVNERDFGVIPMPKYEETQKDYHTYVAEGTGLMIVPKTTDDTDRLGKVLEVLGATGQDSVLTAYYDVCVKTRDSRDVESGRMLDICFSTRCYDLGLMFNWGSVVSTLKDTAPDNLSKTFASTRKSFSKSMKKAFESLGITTEDN